MDKILKARINIFSASSWSSLKLRSFVHILGGYRSLSPLSQQECIDHVPSLDYGSSVSIPPQRLQIVRANSSEHGTQHPDSFREINDEKGDQMQVPGQKFSFPAWTRWMIGSLLTLLLPFLKVRWGSKLERIQGEAEIVVEEVEKVAEMVEKVATVAEKVSEEAAESIQDENSKLKEAAMWVEKASKEAAHDAQLTQDLIHKVEAIEQDMGDLEGMVEPIIGKIIGGGPKAKQ
ncbi:hypothetical protein SAY86_018391 [Trapa natans]|uniref:Uncharacterized protein n=1 Tax=Trapa natans TaxID=22666 RepID=A0AAN7R336_TRANT|nr:hypothetical protein SAY86_018391 [Trapa natans]